MLVHCPHLNLDTEHKEHLLKRGENQLIKKVRFMWCSSTFKPGSVESYKKVEEIKTLKKKNTKELLTLIKTIGDMLPAGQGCGFY